MTTVLKPGPKYVLRSDYGNLAQRVCDLEVFVRRIAEYDDYTHDLVDELKVLYALQHEAQRLLGE